MSTTFPKKHIFSPFGRDTKSQLATMFLTGPLITHNPDRSFTQLRPTSTPPKERLVGIELNPGPPKKSQSIKQDLVKSIADVGAFLGQQVGNITTTKKKKKKSSKTVSPSSSSVSHGAVVNISTGRVRNYSLGGMYSKISLKVPFRCPFSTIVTNASSVLKWQTVSGSAGLSAVLDLTPYYNNIPSQTKIFGNALYNMSLSFSQWRLNRLRLEYQPAVGTSTAGQIVVGYSRENYEAGTIDYGVAASCNDNISFAPWEPCALDIRNLDNDWKYCYFVAGYAGPADQNSSFAGALPMAGVGSFAASTTFGVVSLVGEMEFRGLNDVAGLAARPPEISSLPTSSASTTSPLSSDLTKITEKLGDVAASIKELDDSRYIRISERDLGTLK